MDSSLCESEWEQFWQDGSHFCFCPFLLASVPHVLLWTSWFPLGMHTYFWRCLLIKPTCKASIKHLHIHRTFSGPIFPQTFYLCLYVSSQIFHVFPNIFCVIISVWLFFLWLYFHLWSCCEIIIHIVINLNFFSHLGNVLCKKYNNDSNCNRLSGLVLILSVSEDLWLWNV